MIEEKGHHHMEEMLLHRGIQPTANRLLVLRAMMEAAQPVSLLDLEDRLDTMDRSSIFRCLVLFHSHRLVHGIDDGTGSLKYALCSADCDCEIDEQHTHFHCTQCGKTFCFRNIPTPLVGLPQGFQAQSVNYVLTGLCPECAGRNDA